jgi:hypothetical protein
MLKNVPIIHVRYTHPIKSGHFNLIYIAFIIVPPNSQLNELPDPKRNGEFGIPLRSCCYAVATE